MHERIKLVVLFGGRSAEHDISCISAFNLVRAVDTRRYEVVPVGITRDGRWVNAGDISIEAAAETGALPSPDLAPAASVVPVASLLPAAPDRRTTVVFPLLHGPMGEDGTIQGLLELAGVPYIGTGVLGSSLCMDKSVAKELLSAHGIPQARWMGARVGELSERYRRELGESLGYPLFVKPANLGSSIGISRVADAAELDRAIAEASRYDEYLVFEEGVQGREIEVAILGDLAPRASLPGEIVCDGAFYGYEEKYQSPATKLLIPAPLSEPEVAEVQALALRTFRALRAEAMARVDLFYRSDGRFLVNEVNTIPGFTPISMYPMLWEASGLPYADLIDELVDLALRRHQRRAQFATDRPPDEWRPD
ncbi:MAG: D-alanine--D-alanine ligase family protein [Acidimicrobiales bacterium]